MIGVFSAKRWSGNGKLAVYHMPDCDGGKAPCDLQEGEVVWTSRRGEWERVTIAKRVPAVDCQSGICYTTEELGGDDLLDRLDAAWFFRERPEETVLM